METNFFKKIQIKIGTRLMKDKARRMQRKVKAVNLKKASSVGIIFEVNSDSDLRVVKDLVNSIASADTRIGVVGYLKGKKKDYPYISDKNYLFISDEDFNYLMQPASDSITSFLSWKPDILLVLSQEYYFPIHYLTSLSEAGLKAGQSGLYDNDLDFIFEMNEKSITALAKEMVHYLGDLQTA